MKKITTPVYDFLGISSAAICLLHCLIFPLLTILPFGIIHNPFIDLVFAAVGLFAILNIIKKTNLLIASLLIISMALIWINVLTELLLDIHLDLILAGGIGMIAGHFLNYKSHKK